MFPASPVMVAVAMTRYNQNRYITRCEGSAESSSISGAFSPALHGRRVS